MLHTGNILCQICSIFCCTSSESLLKGFSFAAISRMASIMAKNKKPENFEQALARGAAEDAADLARATVRSFGSQVV